MARAKLHGSVGSAIWYGTQRLVMGCVGKAATGSVCMECSETDRRFMEWEGTAEADAEEREKAHADIMSRKRTISEEMVK